VTDSYVVISPDDSNKVVQGGPYMWDGFQPGSGAWTTPDDGMAWVNDADPTTTFSGTRFAPPEGDRLIEVHEAMAAGYGWPQEPEPDADGDGFPYSQDPDDYDPNVPNQQG